MLQVIGFLAMESPARTYSEAIRDEQVQVFRSIPPLKPEDLVRGQFRGYRKEPGVAPDSKVETFGAVRLQIDSWRWEGVPFFIRAGKSLPTTTTEVLVALRRPPLAKAFAQYGNYVRFRLSPEVQIGIGAQIKKPGEDPNARLMPVELTAVHQETSDDMTPYERLLGDAMTATVPSSPAKMASRWRGRRADYESPTPVRECRPGTWGAGARAADIGR
jgi:glucose-6-phosphate 1-dehydrogenase